MSTLSFKSPAGTSYTVNIGKGSYTLIGAPEPFVIQEDDDTNAFLPIRKTTGYVRFIVNDSSQWENLIPTSATDVTVECSDCHFFGFALPQSYGGLFAYGPSEFSLAIGCPLCALASMKLSYKEENSNPRSLISFSDLLDLLDDGFDSNLDISINYDEIPSEFLGLNVQWNLLFEDDEENNTRQPKYNNLELLEKICQFFGVSARSIGKQIILTDPLSTQHGSTSVNTFLLADTGSTIEIEQGVGLVKVNAQVSDDQDVINLNFDKIIDFNLYDDGEKYVVLELHVDGSGNGSAKYYLSNSQVTSYADAVVDQDYDFYDVQIDFHNNLFIQFCNESPDYVTTPITIYDKRWRGLIMVIKQSNPQQYTFNMNDCSVFYSKKSCFYSGGYFELSGHCYWFDRSSNNDYNEETMYVEFLAVLYIEDGNAKYYWNGSEFEYSTNPIPFHIYSKDGKFGKRSDNSFWWQRNDTVSDTYIIPINSDLSGKIRFGIGPVLDIDGKDEIFFDSIELNYHRDSGYRDKTNKTYVVKGGNFSNTIDFDSFFVTDTPRMKYGLELLVSPNGGFYGNNENDIHIEEDTAERIADYGEDVRRVLTLNLREGDALYGKIGNTAPYWIVYDNYTYYAISISQNPAKGVYTVKFI